MNWEREQPDDSLIAEFSSMRTAVPPELIAQTATNLQRMLARGKGSMRKTVGGSVADYNRSIACWRNSSTSRKAGRFGVLPGARLLPERNTLGVKGRAPHTDVVGESSVTRVGTWDQAPIVTALPESTEGFIHDNCTNAPSGT